MPFGVVSGVGLGMSVLHFGGDRQSGIKGQFEVVLATTIDPQSRNGALIDSEA